MSEHSFEHLSTPGESTERFKKEYDFGWGYSVRWMLYEHTEDGVDFHNETIDQLGLNGTEDILDIGCGQGTTFLKRIEKRNHQGNLFGLDNINSLNYAQAGSKISFIQGDANTMPVRDKSMDVASALFMLYHVDPPETAISEMARIVRHEGKVAISTSHPGHKARHRAFETRIADYLDVPPPARYAKPFETDTAEILMPEYFDSVEKAIEQKTAITIREEDMASDPFKSQGKLADYIGSLKSMLLQYGDQSGRIDEAIEQVVLPEIAREIDNHGKFNEPVLRNLYICTQPRL